jgi:hypothetical protein
MNRSAALKMSSIAGTPDDVARYVRFGLEACGRIVRAAGIQPE